jgi:hypothetical protein
MTSIAPRDAKPIGSLARDLPLGCNLRRAATGDAEHIAALLRADDRIEMEALEGRPALEVLQSWMSGGSRVLTIRGDAVAIYGIVPCLAAGVAAGADNTSGAATPWVAMVATLGRDDLVDVLWLSRFQIDAWQRRWPLLLAVCDVRNRFRADWLGWLGFERQGRVDRFGALGLPFDLHMRDLLVHQGEERVAPVACWTL